MERMEIGDRIEATLPDGSTVTGTIDHFGRQGHPFVIPDGPQLPFIALKCRLIRHGTLREQEMVRRRRMSEFHIVGFRGKVWVEAEVRTVATGTAMPPAPNRRPGPTPRGRRTLGLNPRRGGAGREGK